MVLTELHRCHIIEFWQLSLHSSDRLRLSSVLVWNYSTLIAYTKKTTNTIYASTARLYCHQKIQKRQAKGIPPEFLFLAVSVIIAFLWKTKPLLKQILKHGSWWCGRSKWLCLSSQMYSSSWGIHFSQFFDIHLLWRNRCKYHYRPESMR